MIRKLIIVLLLLSSCKQAVKTKAEMAAHVSNPANELQVSEKTGAIETSLTYRPWQLIVGKRQISGPAINNLKHKYFFVLSLSANHKELLRQLKFSDYSEMVQVLAFRMNEYVSAVPDHKEAVLPDECLFQQTYGMGTANQVLIVFDRSKFENAKHIEIKIKEFGLGTGNLDYRFNLKDINDLNI